MLDHSLAFEWHPHIGIFFQDDVYVDLLQGSQVVFDLCPLDGGWAGDVDLFQGSQVVFGLCLLDGGWAGGYLGSCWACRTSVG